MNCSGPLCSTFTSFPSLPCELKAHILRFLPLKDLLSVRSTTKELRDLVSVVLKEDPVVVCLNCGNQLLRQRDTFQEHNHTHTKKKKPHNVKKTTPSSSPPSNDDDLNLVLSADGSFPDTVLCSIDVGSGDEEEEEQEQEEQEQEESGQEESGQEQWEEGEQGEQEQQEGEQEDEQGGQEGEQEEQEESGVGHVHEGDNNEEGDRSNDGNEEGALVMTCETALTGPDLGSQGHSAPGSADQQLPGCEEEQCSKQDTDTMKKRKWKPSRSNTQVCLFSSECLPSTKCSVAEVWMEDGPSAICSDFVYNVSEREEYFKEMKPDMNATEFWTYRVKDVACGKCGLYLGVHIVSAQQTPLAKPHFTHFTTSLFSVLFYSSGDAFEIGRPSSCWMAASAASQQGRNDSGEARSALSSSVHIGQYHVCKRYTKIVRHYHGRSRDPPKEIPILCGGPKCANVLTFTNHILSTQHCWSIGEDNPAEPACYVNSLCSGSFEVRNERAQQLAQGVMDVGDVFCKACGKQVGWMFMRDHSERNKHCNKNQVGRFGLVNSCIWVGNMPKPNAT